MRRATLPVLALLATAAQAQQPTLQPTQQPIEPEVARRDVRVPRLPSNDFQASLFAGIYATENFGSSSVAGVRLGYAITEDVFVEGSYGKSTVSDEAFRQILPGGGVLTDPQSKLTYYNVAAGWNVLTGESFFGRNIAKASALYLIGGLGSTTFVDQKKQTFVLGFGARLMFNDSVSMQLDVRDHLFSLDLLGKQQSTNNPELTLGVTLHF